MYRQDHSPRPSADTRNIDISPDLFGGLPDQRRNKQDCEDASDRSRYCGVLHRNSTNAAQVQQRAQGSSGLIGRLIEPTPQIALELGKAAEHLVVADLLLSGHRAYLTDQGLPYDVVFDHNGKLLRVQVKCSCTAKGLPHRPGSAPSYCYHIRRVGKGGKRRIGNDEFDLLALVALDIRKIVYLRMSDKVLQCIFLRQPNASKQHGNKKWKNIDEYPVESALAELSP
jgi:hypothetical protein